MQISKHHIQSLQNNVQKVVDQLEALEEGFEPDVEVGQYWKWDTGEVFRVKEVFTKTESCRIQYLNDVEKQWYWADIIEDARLLSDDQVEGALIEEAERRGFEARTKFYDADTDRKTVEQHLHMECLFYEADLDWLCDGYGHVIYYEGNWAEIISDEWELEHTLGDEYAVVKDNKKIGLYCRYEGKISGFPKQEAEAICGALNNMED